jgi:hypothetical protein
MFGTEPSSDEYSQLTVHHDKNTLECRDVAVHASVALFPILPTERLEADK